MNRIKADRLLETTYSGALRVDRAAGVIRGVKILGSASRNGRTYSDAALDQAATLYEGLGVNIDHPDHDAPDADRRFADGFGHLQNVRRTPDGVYGDLVYLKSHALAEQVCEAAERMPEQLGLSHNAEGYVTRRDGRWIVEGITRVRSVDVVRNPATNRGLFESERSTVKHSTRSHAAQTSKQPAASTPQPPGDRFRFAVQQVLESESGSETEKLRRVQELLDETAGAPSGTPSVSSPAGELAALRESLARLERRELARDLLDEAGVVAAPALMDALSRLEDEASMRALIESWPRDAVVPRYQQPQSRQPLRESAAIGRLPVDTKDNKAVAAFLRM